MIAKESTSSRLKEIMRIRNLRQVDIIKLAKPFCNEYGIKLTKSALSQYISGVAEPNQNKVFILAKTLNVDPGWLMGFGKLEEMKNFDVTKDNNNFYIYIGDLNKEQQNVVVSIVDSYRKDRNNK